MVEETQTYRNPTRPPAVSALVSPFLAEEGEEAPADALSERLPAALPALRAYVRALVRSAGPEPEAEDVVQEALTRALSHRGTYDPARPVLPWLKRTALRTFLDLRARPRPRPIPLEEATEPRAPAAADTLAQRELVERLLERLGVREREVLERFHRQGQSVREIAGALGVAEGTVKSLLHRARRRLADGPAEGRP